MEVSKLNIANTEAAEGLDTVAKGSAHAAYLAVFTLREDDLKGGFARSPGHGFLGLIPVHVAASVRDFDPDTIADLNQEAVGYLLVYLDVVLLLDAGAENLAGQVAVVTEKN
jgi:hypothetical protein